MLYRYSAEDAKEFFAVVHTMLHVPPPAAPMKRPYSASPRLARLQERWKARGVVRELFPELTPKDPEYHKQVDTVEHSMRSAGN